MRFVAFALLATACGSARPLAVEPSSPKLRFGRADVYYRPATTAGFRAGATVPRAEVACSVDTLANEPLKIACAAETARGDGAEDERSYRARFAECFQVESVAPTADTLREIERSLSPEKWWPTTAPSVSSTIFVIVTVFRRTSLQVTATLGGNGCEGVHHPCDPGPSREPSPGGWLTDVKRTFATFGPRGYVFHSGERRNLFDETGTQALYAIGERPGPYGGWDDDPLFHLNEAYPRPTYDRLATVQLEDATTQFAVVLDRAVLAAKLGELDLIGQRTRELDDFLVSHAPPLDADARARLAATRDALHGIVRGDYAFGDPCKR